MLTQLQTDPPVQPEAGDGPGALLGLVAAGILSIELPLLTAGVLATVGAARLAGSLPVGASRLPALTAGVIGFLVPWSILIGLR
jgi:hypothetical protein